jgi:hypothetical protein
MSPLADEPSWGAITTIAGRSAAVYVIGDTIESRPL